MYNVCINIYMYVCTYMFIYVHNTYMNIKCPNHIDVKYRARDLEQNYHIIYISYSQETSHLYY